MAPHPLLAPALATLFLAGSVAGCAAASTPKGKPTMETKPLSRKPARIAYSEGWTAYGGTWTKDKSSARVTAGDGVKLVHDRPLETSFDATLRVRITGDKGQAGLLFRIADPAEGRDAFNGYYLGLDIEQQHAIFGRMSRTEPAWTPLVTRSLPVRANTWYRVRVVARGERIQAFVRRDGAKTAEPEWPILDVTDATHPSGALGVRALGADAEFSNIEIAKPSPLAKGPMYSNAGGLIPDIADPHVLRHEGEYYAYGTGGHGIRVYRSKDLVHWSGPVGATDGYALHPKDSWGTKWWWAPEVYHHKDGFRMYYSIEERLGFADSKSPLGPFVQDPKAPRKADSYEIDSHLFVDEDGKPYIYYVHGDRGNVVYVAELEEDRKTIREETAREVLRQSQPWETDSVNEGPFVLKHKGMYYLMYSGNGFTNPMYGVGYATAKHPLGPWTKYPYNPILQSNAYVQGVGHHAVTTSPDGKEMFIVYHTHKSPEDRWPRMLAIDRLRFAPDPDGGPDILEAYGPTVTPQPMPSGSK